MKKESEEFLIKLNGLHSSFQFTFEKEKNNSLLTQFSRPERFGPDKCPIQSTSGTHIYVMYPTPAEPYIPILFAYLHESIC